MRTIPPSRGLSVYRLGSVSHSFSAAASRCSRRRGYSLYESPPLLGGTSGCHADANNPLRDTTCHLDPEILRPSPELGAHQVRSRVSAGHALALLISRQRTTPVPRVPPPQQLASKLKKNDANGYVFLRVSDTAAHENQRAEPAHAHRGKE